MVNSFLDIDSLITPPGCRGADIIHNHESHEMLFCTNGKGYQWGPSGEQTLNTGDVFFYKAGTDHCSVFKDGLTFHCFIIDFPVSMFAPAADGDNDCISIINALSFREGKAVKIRESDREQIKLLFEFILKKFRDKPQYYLIEIKSALMRLLATIANNMNLQSLIPLQSSEELIDQVIKYVEEYSMHQMSVDSILKFCPLSRSHFHASFKKVTGTSFVNYLTKKRIAHACKLLSTGTPVSQVAYQSGFNSHSRFSQVFAKRTGKTPSEYKRTYDETGNI